eukprot:292446-Rhodomonas_salina.2
MDLARGFDLVLACFDRSFDHRFQCGLHSPLSLSFSLSLSLSRLILIHNQQSSSLPSLSFLRAFPLSLPRNPSPITPVYTLSQYQVCKHIRQGVRIACGTSIRVGPPRQGPMERTWAG